MKCFKYNNKNKLSCDVKMCRYWIKHKDSFNCCLNFQSKEKTTLEDIGKIFNVTRMRICQIEKLSIKKMKDIIRKSIK